MSLIWVLAILGSSLIYLRNFLRLHSRGPGDERPIFMAYCAVCAFTTLSQLGLLLKWPLMSIEAVPMGLMRLGVTLEVIRLLNFGEMSASARDKLIGLSICIGVVLASLVSMMDPGSYPGLPAWSYGMRLYLDIGMAAATIITALEARLYAPGVVAIALPHAGAWVAFLLVNIYGMLDRPATLLEWRAFDAAAKIVQGGCLIYSVNLVQPRKTLNLGII